MNIFGITLTTTKHYNELVDRNRLQTKSTAEATASNITALTAHGLLWDALIDILTMASEKPNGTVRRMLSRAEDALQNDALTDVKPDRKWSKGGE